MVSGHRIWCHAGHYRGSDVAHECQRGRGRLPGSTETDLGYSCASITSARLLRGEHRN
jgi:hypothetical protein